MNVATAPLVHELRPKIMERRVRLVAASRSVSADYVNELLAEIDETLEKMDSGSFGLCETCHDPIETDRIHRNPLERFCLDHLSAKELKAHEQDIELATRIQARLLPPKEIVTKAWRTHYRYEPASAVGGDYCEIIVSDDGHSLFFAIGDVAGKGVAASLLMTHLSAIFRSLLSLDLPLEEVISRANRLFCESTSATHYATLVAGRTTETGMDLCNAGHCRPLLLRQDGTSRVDATGLPLGLFSDSRHSVSQIALDPGDSLVLYTDGVTEAQDPQGCSFDEDGLLRSLDGHASRNPIAIVDEVLRDVARFRGAGPIEDDVTVLFVRRHQ